MISWKYKCCSFQMVHSYWAFKHLCLCSRRYQIYPTLISQGSHLVLIHFFYSPFFFLRVTEEPLNFSCYYLCFYLWEIKTVLNSHIGISTTWSKLFYLQQRTTISKVYYSNRIFYYWRRLVFIFELVCFRRDTRS